MAVTITPVSNELGIRIQRGGNSASKTYVAVVDATGSTGTADMANPQAAVLKKMTGTGTGELGYHVGLLHPLAATTGSGYEGLTVEAIDIAPMGGNAVEKYVVRIDWSVSSDIIDLTRPPVDREPIVTFSYEQFEEPFELTKDSSPQPVVNSAGDYFDPQPTTVNKPVVVTYQRNELRSDASRAMNVMLAYNNSVVNSAAFFIRHLVDTSNAPVSVAARKALMTVQEVQPYKEGGVWYARCTYQFHIRSTTWYRRYLDLGYRDINGLVFGSGTGVVDGKPHKLNASGNFTSGTANVRVFTEWDEMDIGTVFNFS